MRYSVFAIAGLMLAALLRSLRAPPHLRSGCGEDAYGKADQWGRIGR